MARRRTPKRPTSLKARCMPGRGEPIPPVQVHGIQNTRRALRRREAQRLRHQLDGGRTDEI